MKALGRPRQVGLVGYRPEVMQVVKVEHSERSIIQNILFNSIYWNKQRHLRRSVSMNSLLALIPVVIPLSLFVAATVAWRDRAVKPRAALLATRIASLFALPIAGVAAVIAFVYGPLVSPLLGAQGLGLAVRLDALSAVMLALVTMLGAFIVQFSRNYLDGDRKQHQFLGDLVLTIACVVGLVVAGNIVQLTLFWVLSSLALHRLLLLYRERPGARIAARKKFIVARVGDACLVLASYLLVRSFGTGDIGDLLAASDAAARSQVATSAPIAAALIALAALLKGAQFPLHGWLVEMQETPTPVSALLHAGILNGGTFLVVRLAQAVQISAATLAALVLVGGFTAIFASVVMITETRMKATLAYSSAAHMGFMMMLCGIGAHTVAIAHLIAHSFYKAHAFLSAGSAVDVAATTRTDERESSIGVRKIALAHASAIAIILCAAAAVGHRVFASFHHTALAVFMTMPLAHLLARAASGTPHLRILGRMSMAAFFTAVAFFALERAGAKALQPLVATPPEQHLSIGILLWGFLAAFLVTTVAQLMLPRTRKSPTWARLYVLVRNGLYANVFFDRLVDAYTAGRSATPARTAPLTGGAPPPPLSSEVVRGAVVRAAHIVAPSWPLETFVAVNPFQGLTDRAFVDAAHVIARTTGARATMPRSFYASAIASGRIVKEHLAEALLEAPTDVHAQLPVTVDALLARIHTDPISRPHRLVPTMADIATKITGRDWARISVERIGSWAASHFDAGQASWRSPWQQLDAYPAFRSEAALDRTPELLGAVGFREAIVRLPSDSFAAIEYALARLGVPENSLELYLQRLLASVGGWASFARYRVWQSDLHHRPDRSLMDVLAIRLAWEVALLDCFEACGARSAWQAAIPDIGDEDRHARGDLALDLVLQSAYEKSWQSIFFDALRPTRKAPPSAPAEVQAAFCIDVRSEIFRRALEANAPECETIGFAGFFGFPIEYVPLGQLNGHAHCPVLFAPKTVVLESVTTDEGTASARAAAIRRLDRRARRAWRSFKTSAIACFGFVGPVGMMYLAKLFTDTFGFTRPAPHPARDGIGRDLRLGPAISPGTHESRAVGIGHDERVSMAEGLLRGMSLTSGFARLVMLVGHGSTSVNNPHASSLDCGACGGHTGEANARVAVKVLNDPAVRKALANRNIVIPSETQFLAALHNTTTDEVAIVDAEVVPDSHADDVRRLHERLIAASASARQQRAPMLGEGASGQRLKARMAARARDWAQTRPEWGLAGCAAFIVAPRHRTQNKDLSGRAFLHSYDWRQDKNFEVLELVLTAPMVVGSWISWQYYASTVDNRVYGCGNKALHNVVGTIGVLEGNGGDLRVGLPWQSVHDGERFVHEPMRLSVVVEAPIDAINAVLAKHPGVRSLLDNGWLHLRVLDDSGNVSHRYLGDLKWERLEQARDRAAA